MSPGSIPEGSTLVTNTMISEASRFVNKAMKGYSQRNSSKEEDLANFFDFCSLIEACILHNHLVTLDGTSIKNFEDNNSLLLRSELINNGILIENVVPCEPFKVPHNVENIVGANQNNRDALSFIFSKRVYDFATFSDRNILLETVKSPIYKTLLKYPDVYSALSSDDYKETLHYTGHYCQNNIYVLRTLLYYNAAKENCLTFFPDYPRIPIFDSLISNIQYSVIVSSYKLFADKLQCEAEDFLKDARPIGLPIPPFTSILLSRCRSAEDILPELLVLRNEYKNLRENLIQLEENRLNCKDIKERNEVRSKIETIFEATSKKYNSHRYTTFKNITDFAADVKNPLIYPYDPTVYVSGLLLKPVELLRDWWYRRPLVQFFDLSEEFREILEYNVLIKKVFRIEFSEQEINSFNKTQSMLNKMFKPK